MRGQAFTLEAIVGALVLVTGLVFAMQVTAVTPLSSSTSNQYIETQQAGTARGILMSAGEEVDGRDSSLKRAVLFWGDEDSNGDREFHCANSNEQPYYTAGPDLSTCDIDSTDPYSDQIPPNKLGSQFGLAYGPGVAYNIVVKYRTATGGTEAQRLVYQGTPSDNAVRVTSTVTLYDDDEVYTSEGVKSGNDVTSGAADFYAPDVSPSGLYNVVKVEVTVWRI